MGALKVQNRAVMDRTMNDPLQRRKVRRRQGALHIIDAQPGTPITALAASWRLAPGQALVFDFPWTEDVERFRSQLYKSQCGSHAHFVTRAHK